jgi:hypothetical protein
VARPSRRRLISRAEYFRTLLPAAKDEEAKRLFLEIIQEEKGRPRDGAVLEEKEDQETS